MLMIWFNSPHDLTTFTPAWAFLIFPMVSPFPVPISPKANCLLQMLVGVVAYNVLRVMDPADPRAIGVLLVGYFFQGLGFFMTFFYICIYMVRYVLLFSLSQSLGSYDSLSIMSTGFLEGHQANGAFVACGPPGFTAIAMINLGANARTLLTTHGLVSPMAGEIWYAGSVLFGLLLFGTFSLFTSTRCLLTRVA